MLNRKIAAVVLAALFALTLFTACSNNTTSTPPAASSTPEVTLPADEVPTPDPAAAADTVMGSWTGVDNSERFAEITELEFEEGAVPTDWIYQYEDNEFFYPAIFADGVLTVEVMDTESAEAFYDAASDMLYVTFQGNTSRFSKS